MRFRLCVAIGAVAAAVFLSTSPCSCAEDDEAKEALEAMLEMNRAQAVAMDSSYTRVITYTKEQAQKKFGEVHRTRYTGTDPLVGFSVTLPYRYICVDNTAVLKVFDPNDSYGHPDGTGVYRCEVWDGRRMICASSQVDLPFSEQEDYSVATSRDAFRDFGDLLNVSCPIPSTFPVFSENWSVERLDEGTFVAKSKAPDRYGATTRLTVSFDLTKAQPVVIRFEMKSVYSEVSASRTEVYHDYEYKEIPLPDRNSTFLMPTRFLVDYFIAREGSQDFLEATTEYRLSSLEHLNEPDAVRATIAELNLKANPDASVFDMDLGIWVQSPNKMANLLGLDELDTIRAERSKAFPLTTASSSSLTRADNESTTASLAKSSDREAVVARIARNSYFTILAVSALILAVLQTLLVIARRLQGKRKP